MTSLKSLWFSSFSLSLLSIPCAMKVCVKELQDFQNSCYLLACFMWHIVYQLSEPTEICFWKSPLFLLLFHELWTLPLHGCYRSNWFQFSYFQPLPLHLVKLKLKSLPVAVLLLYRKRFPIYLFLSLFLTVGDGLYYFSNKLVFLSLWLSKHWSWFCHLG